MYEIDQHTIRFSTGKEQKFPGEISEAIDFDETVVVRITGPDYENSIQNVYGLDYRGNLRWQIPRATSFSAYRPYVAIYRQGEYLEVLNWDGHTVTLDPRGGYILSEGYYTGGYSKSRREPSPRQWV